MKTAINGKIRLKLFWHGAYSGGGMTPIQRVCRIGSLSLWKVVRCNKSPFSKDYYKDDVVRRLVLSHEFVVKWEQPPGSGSTDMWYAVYSKLDGGYVGTPEDAYRYYQRGLRQIQKADPKHKVCSIGYNPTDSKWYGWSHRARYGFAVGDTVKRGDCTASSGWTDEYLAAHPEEDRRLPIGFTAKTGADTKRMAIAFAESVG